MGTFKNIVSKTNADEVVFSIMINENSVSNNQKINAYKNTILDIKNTTLKWNTSEEFVNNEEECNSVINALRNYLTDNNLKGYLEFRDVKNFISIIDTAHIKYPESSVQIFKEIINIENKLSKLEPSDNNEFTNDNLRNIINEKVFNNMISYEVSYTNFFRQVGMIILVNIKIKFNEETKNWLLGLQELGKYDDFVFYQKGKIVDKYTTEEE